MSKKKSEKTEEAKPTGTVAHQVSNHTYKKLLEEYKRDNTRLLEEQKKLQEQISWLQEENKKLRTTNQQLIRKRPW